MKSLYTYILWMAMATFAWVSCTDEKLVETSGSVGDEEVAVTLNFMAQHNDRISVTTRATLDEVPESRVQNFFLFFFVKGTRVYSHYFDASNKLETANQVIASDENNWYVENKSVNNNDDNKTHGTIRAHVPQATGAKIYMVANIDADMVNISPEKLNTIRTEDELIALTATLNQEITSRNGYFPMSGKLENVTINPVIGSGITVDGNTAHVELQRLDAKVEVFVRTATDFETSSTEGGVTTKQTLKGFVPESWRVVNLPKSCYVVGRDTEDCGAEYFNTEAVSFETSEDMTFSMNGQNYTTTLHGFSFYMMENRPEATASVGDFHLRDMRQKDPATGKYTNNPNDMWVYAPENGTYLEIKGEVEMLVDVSSEAKTQTLKANVTYYVHLGDIATYLNDYSINRNTHYRYTITIKGVDKITLEVETSQDGYPENVEEDNSGATGGVYIAKESIYTFDAHYGQRVFCFDAGYIDPEYVTWYVSTPFGKEGTPPSMGGVDIPAGFDYKWIEFLVNEDTEYVTDTHGTTLEVYSQKNQPYPGYKGNPNQPEKSAKLLDVIGLTKLMKEEKIKLDKFLNGETAVNTSLFRKEYDADWDTKFGEERAYRWRMYVTTFVNEFYYEEHPITGDKPTDLWKQFVNQPNRLMHILCDSQKSLDEASSATGSVITIRQRSIQTPYNLNKESLMNAWGCEVLDETAGRGFYFYNTDESVSNNDNLPTAIKTNNSQFNGRYNTAILWGVLSNSTDPTFNGTVQWNTYLDFNRTNDYVSEYMQTDFIRDNYAVMRYAPMMRNRDNDGDGKISADELRWYIASIDQLYGLYFGQLGLSTDAVLYSLENAAQTGNYAYPHPFAGAHKWRNHIVSSTSTGGHPVTIWGEEGISVSNYGTRYSKPAPYSIRCVRNLGMDYASEAEAQAGLRNKENYPTNLVRVIQPATINTNAVYKFDLTNINDKSLRFYTTRELEPGNEHTEMSRLYYGFQTGAIVETGTYTGKLYDDLIAGNSPCAEGWRVPNVREGAMMSLYCASGWWDGYITVSSFYSNGTTPWGNGNDTQSPSWQFGVNFASIGSPSTSNTRSVQDWYPDE